MNDKIKSLLEQFSGEQPFSGAVLVKHDNEIIFSGACGFAHRGFHIENTTNTMFDTASITKLFTATAIVMLAEQGKLQFESKIHDIIDLANTSIPTDVTIYHLLTHTSGIADDAEEENGEDYSALFKDSPNYNIRENRDFLPNFAHKTPNFKAGTSAKYNNCAFILLGIAIEEITGISYREFVTTNIFNAFDMSDTMFVAMDDVGYGVAEGYWQSEDNGVLTWKKNIYSYPPIGTADGGAYTTVHDLDKFIRHIKKLPVSISQPLLNPHTDTLHEWTEQKHHFTKKNGFGFEFIQKNDRTFCMYKEGGNNGVDAIVSYYPHEDTAVTILANQNCDVNGLHKSIENVLFNQN